MTYLKINNIDFSKNCNALEIKTAHNFNAQTNAAGNTVVDYLNKKREIEVGIIPLDQNELASLLAQVNKFNVVVSFLNPQTKALESVSCIIPESNISYYTIQMGKTMANGFSLKFIEL